MKMLPPRTPDSVAYAYEAPDGSTVWVMGRDIPELDTLRDDCVIFRDDGTVELQRELPPSSYPALLAAMASGILIPLSAEAAASPPPPSSPPALHLMR